MFFFFLQLYFLLNWAFSPYNGLFFLKFKFLFHFMNVPIKQNNFYIDYAISSLSCLSSSIACFSMGTFLANFVLYLMPIFAFLWILVWRQTWLLFISFPLSTGYLLLWELRIWVYIMYSEVLLNAVHQCSLHLGEWKTSYPIWMIKGCR